MGILARVVAFARTVVEGARAPEVRVDDGSGAVRTPYHFSAPGDDSQPLPGDIAHVAPAAGAGFGSAVGYQDPSTEPRAGGGEKRIYARSGPGVVACEVFLRADGSLVLSNPAGSVELAPDGALVLRNALASLELSAAGTASLRTILGTFGLDTHAHLAPPGGGLTGPPTPGS